MKKVMLVLASVLFAFTMSAQAPAGAPGQGGMRGGMGRTPEAQVTSLAETVTGLTAEQKTKLTAVYTEMTAKRTAAMEKLRAGGATPDREAMTKVITEITTEQNTKINAILNDAQKAQFKKMQEERAARMGQRGQGGQGGFGGGGVAPAN